MQSLGTGRIIWYDISTEQWIGTWNVRGLYRSGSLKIVARELGKFKLDLVGVQEVRWDRGGTERAEDYKFFCGAGM
jgi:hypothetical protein